MKIHQLPHGARFEYEGVEYVKTGPMFATGNGAQRLIPKYAVLKPLGAVESTGDKANKVSCSRASVLAAFEAFYADCKHRVPQDQQMAVDAARENFLKTLDEA